MEKVEDKMATCVNTFQHLEMSAVRRKTPFPDSILGFDEGDFCSFAKENLPTEIGKSRHWTQIFACGCTSNAPRFAQGQPNGYFQMKELDGTTEPIARMNMLNESWRRLSLLSSTCQHVATLQCDSCAEKDSLSLCRRLVMA